MESSRKIQNTRPRRGGKTQGPSHKDSRKAVSHTKPHIYTSFHAYTPGTNAGKLFPSSTLSPFFFLFFLPFSFSVLHSEPLVSFSPSHVCEVCATSPRLNSARKCLSSGRVASFQLGCDDVSTPCSVSGGEGEETKRFPFIRPSFPVNKSLCATVNFLSSPRGDRLGKGISVALMKSLA